MRKARVLAPETLKNSYYHCVSRVVGREFILGEVEREKFVELMRLYEKLYGLQVMTYCIMSNHFHILVRVPKRPEVDMTDEELVALVRETLGEKTANDLSYALESLKAGCIENAYEDLRERWFSKMWNVSTFMKMVKQRFSYWYNQRTSRKGTLWEERFHSALVEGEGQALRMMAAYIDLNPVRAGI